jgi:hypothetical protein
MRLEDFPEVFKIKVKVDPETGCWNWTGYLDKKGYGTIYLGFRVSKLAHRYALLTSLGLSLDSYHLVLHKNECHNCKCCNPEHLYLGTTAQNTIDSVVLGTHKGWPREAGRAASLKRRSKTHCKWGHELAGDNTHLDTLGRRVCLACHRMSEAKSKAKKKTQKPKLP